MLPSIVGILVLGVGVGLVYLGVHGAPWLTVYPAVVPPGFGQGGGLAGEAGGHA